MRRFLLLAAMAIVMADTPPISPNVHVGWLVGVFVVYSLHPGTQIARRGAEVTAEKINSVRVLRLRALLYGLRPSL